MNDTDERAYNDARRAAGWTHHGYAINVKDHKPYGDLDGAREILTEQEIEAIYSTVQEQFWADAGQVAQDHGFEDVYSEGRSGGWAVPQPQPSTDDMWEHQIEEWERETFAPFAKAIETLAEEAREWFLQDVAEAAEDRKRTTRHNELAAAGWRY